MDLAHVFGMPGCANDINVLEFSPLGKKMAEDKYPTPVEYFFEVQKRFIPYWVADGIYPKCPVFVQTLTNPTTQKKSCKPHGKLRGKMLSMLSGFCKVSGTYYEGLVVFCEGSL